MSESSIRVHAEVVGFETIAHRSADCKAIHRRGLFRRRKTISVKVTPEVLEPGQMATGHMQRCPVCWTEPSPN
jgi:hypothetical protein